MPFSAACGACRFHCRKCTENCPFAPYIPNWAHQKFAKAHKVFGSKNLARRINDLDPSERAAAVNGFLFEAEARIQDPIYGSAGQIWDLQNRLKQFQDEIFAAKNELSMYIGPAAMMQIYNPENSAQLANMFNIQPTLGLPGQAHGNQLVIREPQLHQQYQHHPVLQQQQLLQQQYEIEGLIDGLDNAGYAGQTIASGFLDHTEENMVPSMGFDSYNNRIYNTLQEQPQQQQQPSEIEGLVDGFDNMRNAGQVIASGFDLTEADRLQSLGSYDNSMYNMHEQPQPSSEIEGLFDTRNAGQANASWFIDITEVDTSSSLGLDSSNNSMYHTHHQQQQQQQQSESEEFFDGFDNTGDAGQVSTSGLFDLTEENMVQSLSFGSDHNNMYHTHNQQQQQQQQQQSSFENEASVDRFDSTRNAGQATPSGFIDLTEEDMLSSLGLSSYNNSMYNTSQQQHQQSEIEGLFDEFSNTVDNRQISASGLFRLPEEDMLQSTSFGSYDNSMYNTHNQQQQQQQQQQQLQYQHPLHLQVDQLLVQRPEQPQLPNRYGVNEGVFVGRPPI